MIIEVCPNCKMTLEHYVITTFPPITCVRCQNCGFKHETKQKIEYVVYDYSEEEDVPSKEAPQGDTVTGNIAVDGITYSVNKATAFLREEIPSLCTACKEIADKAKEFFQN